MTLQHVEDATRMLKSRVVVVLIELGGLAATIFSMTAAGIGMSGPPNPAFLVGALVQPGIDGIFVVLGIPSGEDAAEIVRQLEIVAQDRRSVGVVNYVLTEFFV